MHGVGTNETSETSDVVYCNGIGWDDATSWPPHMLRSGVNSGGTGWGFGQFFILLKNSKYGILAPISKEIVGAPSSPLNIKIELMTLLRSITPTHIRYTHGSLKSSNEEALMFPDAEHTAPSGVGKK